MKITKTTTARRKTAQQLAAAWTTGDGVHSNFVPSSANGEIKSFRTRSIGRTGVRI